MRLCYVFHVIGTLEWDHIERAIESAQANTWGDGWATVVLYNGGDHSVEAIRQLLTPPSERTELDIYPYDPNTPKSAVADWDQIARHIDGHDAYLIHKADFYLGNRAIEAFERIARTNDRPWFAQFHKLNMKEYATVDDYRRYAALSFGDAMCLPDTAQNPRDWRAKLAVPGNPILDGVMHGYSESCRPLYAPSQAERERKWGYAQSISDIGNHPDVTLVQDPDLVAYHMWHDTPDRKDARKQNVGNRW